MGGGRVVVSTFFFVLVFENVQIWTPPPPLSARGVGGQTPQKGKNHVFLHDFFFSRGGGGGGWDPVAPPPTPGSATGGYSKNLFCIQTKVYSLCKPARWSHRSIHIVQKPHESSHSIIFPKSATQYSNEHLLFYLHISNWNPTTLHHIHLWILMYTPFFGLFFFLSLSLSPFTNICSPIFVLLCMHWG